MYFRENKIKHDGTCNICGSEPSTGIRHHEMAVHEVYALEHWGPHSVAEWARPHVQGWSDGSVPLPTNEECTAMMPPHGLVKNAPRRS